MAEFHKLEIKSVIKVTVDCVTISFDIPSEIVSDFAFKAGQYITIKSMIDGEEVRRDYSLCSSPYDNELIVAVKKVEGGVFSSFANSILKAGDVVDVSSPRGRFIYEPSGTNSETIVAFAAGSGITPIMSIIKTVLTQETDSKMILVYGNKSPKDAIFYDTLKEIQTDHPNRFFVHYVYSQSREEDALFGRIEKSTVNYIINNAYNDTQIKVFYLCGPEAMINTVSDTLKSNNVEDSKILFELFTTAPKVESNEESIAEGKTQITVTVDDEETTFTMPNNKSILEAALEKDIDAPYSCQGGICSSCLARITDGSASMRQNNILTDEEVEDGLILTCQAHPTTPKIYIDYDDV